VPVGRESFSMPAKLAGVSGSAGPQRRAPAVALVLALALAPSCTCGDGSETTSPTPGPPDGEVRTLNVGNPARGLDSQPDYDGQARELRKDVLPRLPDPLPDATTACTQMLDAVAEFYEKTESDAAPQLQVLKATRADELKACTGETSAAAASCVVLLAREQAGEYPWLLDQCSRAFPRSGS
jgi:hypothetical protein